MIFVLYENHKIHQNSHVFKPQKIKSPRAKFIDHTAVKKLSDGTHPSHVETVSSYWGLRDYRLNKPDTVSIQQTSFFNDHDKEEITVHEDAWAGGNNIFINIEHPSARGSETVTCGQEILHIVESANRFNQLLNESIHQNIVDILTDDVLDEFNRTNIDIGTAPQADIDNCIRRILQYQTFRYNANITDVINSVNSELRRRNIHKTL